MIGKAGFKPLIVYFMLKNEISVLLKNSVILYMIFSLFL